MYATRQAVADGLSGAQRSCDAVIAPKITYDIWRTDPAYCNLRPVETVFSSVAGWVTNRRSPCVQLAFEWALLQMSESGCVPCGPCARLHTRGDDHARGPTTRHTPYRPCTHVHVRLSPPLHLLARRSEIERSRNSWLTETQCTSVGALQASASSRRARQLSASTTEDAGQPSSLLERVGRRLRGSGTSDVAGSSGGDEADVRMLTLVDFSGE